VDDRIADAVAHHAARLGVSRSWLIATLLADCFNIDLDDDERAFL